MASDLSLPRACATWLADVDRIMKRDWCVDTSDAGWSAEDTLRYWRYGDGPDLFVEWFAEKYDLISREQWDPSSLHGLSIPR